MSASVIPIGPTVTIPMGSGKAAISLAARAYIEIREKILKGELEVGAVISRRKLAERLNISVPPVTEALQQLEAEGLLESKPRVGTRVRIPTREGIEDRSVVREALESQAARLFAVRATAEEKAALRLMGRQVDQLYACCETQAVDAGFLFSANMYHMSLHMRIAECARSAALRDAIEKEQVLIFSWLYETAVERRSLASDYHTRLTEALATGTPDEADTAMRHHIRVGLQEVLLQLDRLKSSTATWRKKEKRPSAG